MTIVDEFDTLLTWCNKEIALSSHLVYAVRALIVIVIQRVETPTRQYFLAVYFLKRSWIIPVSTWLWRHWLRSQHYKSFSRRFRHSRCRCPISPLESSSKQILEYFWFPFPTLLTRIKLQSYLTVGIWLPPNEQ